MIAGLEVWQEELQQLRHVGRQLSEAMARGAVELREQGWEPSESLLQQMQQYRADFRRLRECVLEGRGGGSSRIVSLQELDGELARREQLATALDRVNTASRLHGTAGDAASPMLDRWRNEISTVKADLTSPAPSDELVHSLHAGDHPLVMAVRLVDDADNLNDDEWGHAMATVTSALGRDFATALARGRLTLHDEPIETLSNS